MTGVATLVAAFDIGPIARHLAMLAVFDARGWDKARSYIGDYMKDDVLENIGDQKLFDGSAMPQSKSAIKHRGKTLLWKGRLRDSYTYQLVPGGVEVGSNVKYAAIHHFGGEAGRLNARVTLPARPVLGVAARQERQIGDFLIAEIQRTQRT